MKSETLPPALPAHSITWRYGLFWHSVDRNVLRTVYVVVLWLSFETSCVLFTSSFFGRRFCTINLRTLTPLPGVQSSIARLFAPVSVDSGRVIVSLPFHIWKQKCALDAPGALKGTHFHTKWRPLWQPPSGSISKQPLAADPAAAASSEQDAWARVWRTPVGPSHEAEAPWDLVPPVRLPPPASPYIAHQIRKVCAQFPTRTGLGADGWQPHILARASDRCLAVLASIIMAVQMLGKWPTHFFSAATDDGGLRPWGLLPTVVRIWEALCFTRVQAWAETWLPDWDWSAAGRSALSAVWLTALHDEAKSSDEHSATALLDITKAYEQIPHWLVWCLASMAGAPSLWLRLYLQVGAHPRRLIVGPCVTEPLAARQGVVAGSRLGNMIMVLATAFIIRKVRDLHPVVSPITYVDDLALRCVGPLLFSRMLCPRRWPLFCAWPGLWARSLSA